MATFLLPFMYQLQPTSSRLLARLIPSAHGFVNHCYIMPKIVSHSGSHCGGRDLRGSTWSVLGSQP